MLCEFYLQRYEELIDQYENKMPESARESPLTQFLVFKTALAMFDDTMGI